MCQSKPSRQGFCLKRHILTFFAMAPFSTPDIISEEFALSTSTGTEMALLVLARTLNSRLTPEEIQGVLRTQLQPLIGFDSLALSLLQSEQLQPIGPDHAEGFSSPEYQNQLRQMMQSGSLWSENDLPATPSTRVRARIVMALRVRSQSIGVLHIESFQPRQWTRDELLLVQLAGELAGTAIENARMSSQREEQDAAHAETLALLRAVQEASAEGICLVSGRGELLSYNQRFADLWCLDEAAQLLHAQRGTLMSHVLEQLADPDEFLFTLGELWERPDVAQHEVALRDGRVFERYSAPSIAPASQGKEARYLGRIWTFSDITERKATERQLARQAFYDSVTGLPNRVLFAERLGRALGALARSPRHLAVLFLDLDRFKIINDSLGHESGDQLLVQVASRLRDSLRPGDTAARFGGDEFVVLLEDVASSEAAIAIADRIVQALQSPFYLGEHNVRVTASIGIVLGSNPEESPEEILRKADVAMYRAKNGGKARYQLFSEELSLAAIERCQLELELSSALLNKQIEVFYQPLLALENDRVGAFEALVRWNHPRRGMVLPDEFVSIAEESDLIISLGEHVLRVACEQARAWSDEFDFPVLMHVNLSARQFETGELVAQISRILHETRLPASQLMVEITESALMSDPKSAARQLELLKKLGVGISIDDFGTGYSSLAYLEWFPIDLLKIDRAFVARLESSETLVRAVTSLGHALGLQIAAEGIENNAQLDAIRGFGCRWGQGFLFSRPVPASEAVAFLKPVQAD